MIILIKITVDDLLNNCDAKLLIGNKDVVINECFIDSKKKNYNGCFFGIKGNKVDGSLFYKEAFDNGADICVINKIYDLDLKGYDDKTVIVAEDTLKVLHQLAAYKRSLFKGDVVAVTGSVGKTSTKELIASVLEKKYKVLKTEGNQNSQIGLPLTILRLKDEDVMVLEMGMNNIGQIHNLSLIAKPNISVITNIYDSHIGNLGSKENILKAKLEIVDGMDSGVLIINNDNNMLNKLDNYINNIKVLSVGIENKSNVMAKNIVSGFNTNFDISDIKGFNIVGGKKFIYNALVAYLIGKLFGLSRSMIKQGINNVNKVKHRLEVINLEDDITIIDDTYNASYESVKAALDYVKNFDKKKIIILGDILELGKEAKKVHKKIGEELLKIDIDYLVAIGKYSKNIINKELIKKIKRRNIKHFKNEAKARKHITKIIKDNIVILVKGSNGINLVDLVNFIKQQIN